MSSMRVHLFKGAGWLPAVACCLTLAACGGNSDQLDVGALVRGEGKALEASPAIKYKTLFQDPGANPTPDVSLESHVVTLVDRTPAGESISFAVRDWNRAPIVDALIRANARGVQLKGVIDGSERNRAILINMITTIGGGKIIFCGAPTFQFLSCITNVGAPSLMHNKLWAFSKLDTGEQNVVVATSMNWLEPTQLHYYNDMVEIEGDVALYNGFVQFVDDMHAQRRSDDYYHITPGDDGRNTMFPSPRRQANLDVDDTIVDRLNEIDCSVGGSPTGKGLIRVANMAFRIERKIIMPKLIELKRQGCDIELIFSNIDGGLLAPMLAEGIPYIPIFDRAVAATPTTPARPQVIVHSKFWTVDAGSTVTGTRTKVVYAGSSNWRLDEQKSDDLLLRIFDDGVYDSYLNYWELIKSRRVSNQNRPANDTVVPTSALGASPAPNANGWNNTDVELTIAASDGQNVGAVGLSRLHVELSGAQTGSFDFLGEEFGYNLQKLTVTAEGTTTISYWSEDVRGKREATKTHVVKIDKTAPAVTSSQAPAANAAGWNNSDVTVTFSGSDAGSGLAGASEQQLVFSTDGANQGGSATFTDLAGNSSTATVSGINIDKTAPTLAGLPTGCDIWPPNNKMVHVADVSAADATSGVASFSVSASSNTDDTGDIAISGGSVSLRAEKKKGGDRVYVINATASDAAGNSTSGSATCTVPHSQGH